MLASQVRQFKANTMTGQDDTKALAAEVVDLLHPDLFSRPFSRAENIPEEQANLIIAHRRAFLDQYRETLVVLYGRHLTTAQLQALLDFHGSEMGRSIKQAQKNLYRELQGIQEKRHEEQNRKKPGKGGAVIRTITKKTDFFSPDDDMG